MNFLDIFSFLRIEIGFVIAVFVALALGKILINAVQRRRYPPGPYGLPIVGYLPFLTKFSHLKLQELSKKYGPIFSLRLGFTDVVVLNSAKVIKDVVSKPEVLGRPEQLAFNVIAKTPFFSNGKVWSDHRRFILHALRDLGLGKSLLHDHIKDEIHHFLQKIEQEAGKPCNVKKLLTPSMSNNICSLIFGKRYDYEDPERKYLDSLLDGVTQSISTTSAGLFFPLLMKLPFINRFLNLEKLKKLLGSVRKLVKEKIEDHKLTLDKNNPRDLIDSYLVELEARKLVDKQTVLSEEFLPGAVQNLFGAGSETVRTTIGWALYTMAAEPEVQEKVQHEIDNVLGSECEPSFENMKDMPYVQAVLYELMRWRTVAPISPLRMALADVEVYDYVIPKGTLVMPNLWAAHHDPECWDNPAKFQPERFLSQDRKTVIKSENWIPFSHGKRACPGEGLAVIESFLYFTYILQKFKITMPPGTTPDLEGVLTISYHPKPHQLCFSPRR